MTKKIFTIILSLVSFFGFLLVAFSFVLHFSVDSLFSQVSASGLGLSGYSPQNSTLSQKSHIPLYNSVNLPKESYVPFAMKLYDSFPQTDSVIEGQDPSSEPENEQPSLPAGVFPVIPLDLSENQTTTTLLCKNESKYSPDVNQLLNNDYPLTYSKTVSASSEFQPLVLIVHTHGTECYLPEGAQTYSENTPTRSQDTSLNVVTVGKVLADTLNSKGIDTVHCETMFDAESYSESYNLSENAVKEYLAKYPSIQYVFDVHRDSIVRENNEKIKPITTVNGSTAAQAMFVVGTDSSGADHPDWINNLTVASFFQQKLIENYGNIMRPINLRSASFNAEHAPGSILIEIGTCGNTVEEAKYCASLLANTIADVILNDGK